MRYYKGIRVTPNSVKRKTCKECRYPMKTCVCSAVNLVHNNTRIIILQHKNEIKNAKNTARLLTLCLNDIELIEATDSDGMHQLQSICETSPESIALFFPSEHSVAFETSYPVEPVAQNPIKHILFIDATWRKAKRLYLSHEYLQRIPSFHFEQAQQGKYRIRKTSIDNGLSTLEAVAYVLANTDTHSVDPLYALFEKMQSFWPAH